MVLTESAARILYRVKFTYSLPNKQYECITLGASDTTFLSLRAGSIDSWLCWIYAILFFWLLLFPSEKERLLPWGRFQIALMSDAKPLQTQATSLGGKRELSFMLRLHTHRVWIDRRGAKSPLLMVCSLLS